MIPNNTNGTLEVTISEINDSKLAGTDAPNNRSKMCNSKSRNVQKQKTRTPGIRMRELVSSPG